MAIIPLELFLYDSLKDTSPQGAVEAYGKVYLLILLTPCIAIAVCLLHWYGNRPMKETNSNNNSNNNYSDNNNSQNNYSDSNYSDSNYSKNNYSNNSSKKEQPLLERIRHAGRAFFQIKGIILLGCLSELVYEKYSGRKSSIYGKDSGIPYMWVLYRLDKIVLVLGSVFGGYLLNGLRNTFLLFRLQTGLLVMFTVINLVLTYFNVNMFWMHFLMQFILGLANLSLKITMTSVFLQVIGKKSAYVAFAMFTAFRAILFACAEVPEFYIFVDKKNASSKENFVFSVFLLGMAMTAAVMALVAVEKGKVENIIEKDELSK